MGIDVVRRSRGGAQDGVTLIELVVAVAILSVLLVGVSATVIRVLDLTQNNAARVVAANLAASAIADLRVMEFDDLEPLATSDPAAVWTESVDGRAYELTRSIAWSTNDADPGPCVGSVAAADDNILRLTVEVTWARSLGSRPVKTETSVSPPIERYAGGGTIAVFVSDHQSPPVGVANVEVELAGPLDGAVGYVTAATNAEGCAVFQGLTRGNYEATLTKPGYIDIDQQVTPVAQQQSAPRTWSTMAFRYAPEGTLQVQPAGWAPGSELPVDPLAWYASNERESSPFTYSTTADVARLFPGLYDLGIGSCRDTDVAPQPGDPGTVESSSAAVVPVTIGSFQVDWSDAIKAATAARRSIDLVALPPENVCWDGVEEIALPVIGEAETGRVFALPYGQGWRIVARYAGTDLDVKSVDLSVDDAGTPPLVVFDFEPPIAPVDDIPGLKFWIDAKDTESMTVTTGSRVDQWRDKSGGNRHATAPSSDWRPALVPGAFGPHAAVRFDGTEGLRFDGSFMAGKDYTVVAVVQRRGTKSENYYLGGTGGSQNENLHLGWRTSTVLTHAQYSNDYDMNVPGYGTPSPEIHSFRHSASDGKNTWVDGSAVAAGSSGNTSPLGGWDGAAVGAYGSSGFAGDVAEIQIYDRALTDAERADVEQYMKDRWNYTTTVPGGLIAIGGDVTEAAGQRVHTFRSSGAFTVSQPGDIEVLVVGGGGGGGTSRGFSDAGAGGGGAGGVVHRQGQSVTSGTIAVQVGAGGAGGSGNDNITGTDGSASTFGGLNALGGGGGAGGNTAGRPGGSGGGARGASGGAAQQPGTTSGGFGWRGGNHAASPAGASATGGGGAGSRAEDLTGTKGQRGGNGGQGLAFSTSGTERRYAGGGGAGTAKNNLPVGIGVDGGGSGGRNGSSASPGNSNSGGGGGGGNNNVNGGNGGSGVVIVRYPLGATTEVSRW